MTTTTIKQYRPLRSDIQIHKWTDYLKAINWSWLLQRIPMLLFAIVSSYGVGHYLAIGGIPFPFDFLGGISFDIGFLGVIAIADQQLKKTIQSQIAFYVLNSVMAGLAAIFNVLSHSDGMYANITPEDITAGAPFAIVGLAFALYYNTVMQQQINEEVETLAQIEQERKEKEKYLRENPALCECGQRFTDNRRRYLHRRSCKVYQESTKDQI